MQVLYQLSYDPVDEPRGGFDTSTFPVGMFSIQLPGQDVARGACGAEARTGLTRRTLSGHQELVKACPGSPRGEPGCTRAHGYRAR